MVTERPLRDFLTMVEEGKPLTYSRWGVHEWQVLFGERNGYIPKDGHFYFPELCREMSQLMLSRPAYQLGIPGNLLREQGDRINAYLIGLGLADLNWYNDIFGVETASDLQDILGIICRVPLLIVGPSRLRRLRSLLHFRAFVDVPPRNQYLCKDELVRNTLAALEDCKTPALVTISAGVISPLIVAALHRRVGEFHQLVDVGKLWESFVRGRM